MPVRSAGRPALVPTVLLLALVLAACGSAASPGPTGGPTGSPAPTTPSGQIEHPTGADQVILRVESGGGFVAPGFFVTQGPSFSLFGDGTVIFRDASDVAPNPIGTLTPGIPYRITRLTEEQVQTLLQFAVGPGALGIARPFYDPGNVADVPATTFSLSAGGVVKTVSVVGLGMDLWPDNVDAPIVAALATLGERLATFKDEVGDPPTWSPPRFRGILLEDASNPPAPWPWTTISPEDFKPPADRNRPSFPIRVMTSDELKALGLAGIEGGLQGLTLTAPSGKVYGLALRPLLPDEKD